MSDIYAWYSLIGTAGTALGMMVCGWVMSLLQDTKQWDFVPACRVVFFIYAAVGAIKFVLTMGLSKSVEVKKKDSNTTNGSSETDPLLASNGQEESVVTTKQRKRFFLPGVEPELVGLVTSLLLLFGLDAFGSSLASLYVILQPFPYFLLTAQVVDNILLPPQIRHVGRRTRLPLFHQQHYPSSLHARRLQHRKTIWQRTHHGLYAFTVMHIPRYNVSSQFPTTGNDITNRKGMYTKHGRGAKGSVFGGSAARGTADGNHGHD